MTPRLKEIRLPAGDIGSIRVAYPSFQGEAISLDPTWLAEGYDGVRLIGEGRGRTAIRCTSHDGITLKVGRHPGIVALEGVDLYAGHSRAALIGVPDKTRPIARKFAFWFKSATMTVLPPPAGSTGRPAWGFHLYQVDDLFQDVALDATHASEHAYYGHGHARFGSVWQRVKVRGAGGECDKVRSDAGETHWAGRQVWIIREDCEYGHWYQLHSNRGGAASVRQGVAANCRWTRCSFFCGQALGTLPAHLRSRTIMVTAEPNSYDALTGAVDLVGGFGTGKVEIDRCGASGGPGTENLSLLARVGVVAGPMQAATSVRVLDSGFYGQNMQLQLGGIPAGQTLVRGCNTPAHRAYLDARGFNTEHEAVIALQHHTIPISQGLIR